MLKRYRLALLSAGLALASQGATAATDWVGTADYTAGPNGVASGDVVTDFHAYDAGPGAALLQNTTSGSMLAISEGDTLQGYVQSYISGHLNLGGTGIASPSLNTTGSGGGYELTFVADFQETITSVAGSAIGFDVLPGGSWSVYLDGTPDYNFAADSGFADGAAILGGTISSGQGTANNLGTALFGVSTIDLSVDFFDAAIFEPDTVLAGSSVFTLQLGLGAPIAATSVLGVAAVPGDLIFTADGNLELKAVPVPAAVWLFGSALVGILAVGRRRSMAV